MAQPSNKTTRLPRYSKVAWLDNEKWTDCARRASEIAGLPVADKLAKDGRVRYDQESISTRMAPSIISTRIMRIRLRTAREGLQSPSLWPPNYETSPMRSGLVNLVLRKPNGLCSIIWRLLDEPDFKRRPWSTPRTSSTPERGSPNALMSKVDHTTSATRPASESGWRSIPAAKSC
jgi:hypothetical protein